MITLHSLGKDSQNEMQQEFYGHVTPLEPASASHPADGIVNATIIFSMFR